KPAGDQPVAIAQLLEGLRRGDMRQTLLGATGTGKTFTMAQVIAAWGRPTLVMAHNKTLAAQLYGEFKSLFPENRVEYFVSYFDYYQPEAYIPSSDTYIEKDSLINEQIDKLRHSATRSLLERNDVIIIASVSCIYGLGSPEAYQGMLLRLEVGEKVSRKSILAKMVELQYSRNDADLGRANFRARGDVIEVIPAYDTEKGIRIELFGDEVESLSFFEPLTGKRIEKLDKMCLFPASHYVTPKDKLLRAMDSIRTELQERLEELRGQGFLLEAQRLEQRTTYDLEMIEELGYCSGIENYSLHLEGRARGTPPPTLLDYFPKDWLLILDESHQTVPQVGGMYRGDQNRKETLVRFGFRIPSAVDNRPLKFEEFDQRLDRVIYVSATPGAYELQQSLGVVVEQVIRPTGLLDPLVEVRPAASQVDDLLGELRACTKKGERVLVTTLTKRMAQELTDYYKELGVKCRYLHSDIDTLERMQILRELRQGVFDVLVGINLLREGLDLPEVALVAVLDADKEGFLRSGTSLIQTIGRAARNADGRVILYADQETPSMKLAIGETARRRTLQMAYNAEHGITPQTIKKNMDNPLWKILDADYVTPSKDRDELEAARAKTPELDRERIPQTIQKLRTEMKAAAAKLDFERAAEIRDQIKNLEAMFLKEG
ncbi:MAG TPA: excinuclease ABC subunit UvrB, partial [Myxococcota bacterium]|nr:excinuclease ABC subunit UvrB [Myxococcota bacterium]